ncbi:MAG: signal peptidase I [Planctomycetota bacterium]
MAKKKKKNRRSPFPEDHEKRMPPPPEESILADDPSPGIFGFFRNIGVRETIESLIIAIVLALLFRAYEAEAFIIPTGSMAPSLNGQHIDLQCDQCGFQYHSGASDEADMPASAEYDVYRVGSTRCPICRYETLLQRDANSLRKPDHESNKGDRILVNKFVYDFSEPQRYDVIVFKNPNNGKQNYIKRLIGLPGENILIENGDIYVMESSGNGWTRTITRKPPRKLRHILQVVDDTNFIGEKLKTVEWPSRWQSFSDGSTWDIAESDGHPTFAPTGEGESWLRYRHFQPFNSEWPTIENGVLPQRFRNSLPLGQLIGDQYSYNDSVAKGELRNVDNRVPRNRGLHWVGDIGLECWVDVESSKGEIIFDVVEGGAHFLCSIDIATGKATLTADDSSVDTKVTFKDADGQAVKLPTANTNLVGAGSYHVEYVNADDKIHLWINNRYIEFDAATFERKGIPIPTYSTSDAGDAEPLGVGTKGSTIKITRLKVVRDIYYTSAKGYVSRPSSNPFLSNESGMDPNKILQLKRRPDLWSTPVAAQIFRLKKGQTEPMFELLDSEDNAKDQFLPMGDNSPRSSDGRVWRGPKFVERDLLIGRALFVYWPHTLNRPIPFFPNFGEMGFIR